MNQMGSKKSADRSPQRRACARDHGLRRASSPSRRSICEGGLPSQSSGSIGIIVARCVLPVLTFLLLLVGAGCGSTRDISNDKKYVTDYRVGDLFRTLQPVYLWSGQLTRTKAHDISETVETGSRIRITKVRLHEGEVGRQMLISGRILDGHLADREVELWPISQFQVQRDRGVAVYFVDTTILKRIPD